MDSAKPLFGTKNASSEASDGGGDTLDEPEPLSMALKSGYRRWPPYQAGSARGANMDREPDEEPQPLTRELKGGALTSMTSACSSSLEGAPAALRPPISAFWVSCVPRSCLRGRWSLAGHAGGAAGSRHAPCCPQNRLPHMTLAGFGRELPEISHPPVGQGQGQGGRRAQQS